MKQFITLFYLLILAQLSIAQTPSTNEWQLSPRIGWDIPTYDNNTPFIDYKGGMDLGISVDYYWDWFGLGLDFDYIKNKPKSTYPTTNLYETGGTSPITNFVLNEQKISRAFIGIGPNLRWLNNPQNLQLELNTRLGISSIKGGRTLLAGPTIANPLNFHAGYDQKSIFSFKGQLKLTYFFNSSIGIHLGSYYLRHFNVDELSEGGVSSFYRPFTEFEEINRLNSNGLERANCACDIWSIGVFAGVTFRFPKKASPPAPPLPTNECPVCLEDHSPHCCTTCGCNVTVTARDKYTSETLPNTDVVLTDKNGNIVQTGTTNSYGVVVFNDVLPADYLINAKLYNVSLEETSLLKSEFDSCIKNNENVQKIIEYGDMNFILKGKVVECNFSKGIEQVDIKLKDKFNATEKNTLSDSEGVFIFHLKQVSTYILNGKKDGYFSNSTEVNTSSYNRNSTLFIDFEMCIDPCGKAIKLDNILFEVAKWDILPNSIPDLEKVIKLMESNPDIVVEMSSHTDARGRHSYNQNLSQKRAESTVNYLVSRGIHRSRLIPRGAGETELLNSCSDGVTCSEEEHSINRRTEFKVVCNN